MHMLGICFLAYLDARAHNCGSFRDIPTIHVFVIVFVSLHIDILSFLLIILNSIGVIYLYSSYLKKKMPQV